MNEQIRALALEAGGGLSCIAEPLEHPWKFSESELEKFAELIVKECVGVVEGGSFLHDQAPTAIFARGCSGAIKRHFGVEE